MGEDIPIVTTTINTIIVQKVGVITRHSSPMFSRISSISPRAFIGSSPVIRKNRCARATDSPGLHHSPLSRKKFS